MTKDKIISYAYAVLEITKMVLVITTNTAIKLASEGKQEVIKQYREYNQKHSSLREAQKKLAEAAELAKESMKSAQKKITEDKKPGEKTAAKKK